MRRGPWSLALILLLSLPAFLIGQRWGLPSRAADRYLFGDRKVWSGHEILCLSGGWNAEADAGSDVSRSPIARGDRPVVVNDTDAQRARIALRYRLFTYQPDEMITLRALSAMRPGTGRLGGLDPRLYQYGGLWIYPVGALLKVGSLFHWVTLRRDVEFYIDNPDAFGRFYVIARFYAAAWGLIGVAAVWKIVRRICGGWVFASAAGLIFAYMPAVVNAGHEAKPHLPGAVLMMLAVLAGSRFVETGRGRWAWAAGVLCGASTGMVLSGYPAFLILPVMVLLPRDLTWGRRVRTLLFATLIGVAVYAVTNPYVWLNLLFNRTVLRSNLGNTVAMYHASVSPQSIWNGMRLVAFGAGPLVAVAGALGTIALATRAAKMFGSREGVETRRRATGLLLVTPAIWLGVQFFALAGDKPGEYGRFALYLDAVLAIEGLVAVATFIGNFPLLPKPMAPTGASDEAFHAREDRENAEFLQALIVGLLLSATLLQGAFYLHAFHADSRPDTSRLRAAEELFAMHAMAQQVLGGRKQPVLVVGAEPAPYCMPPVDLFRWQIRLAPRNRSAREMAGRNEAWVMPVDVVGEGDEWSWLESTRLSWANKPFAIGPEPSR